MRIGRIKQQGNLMEIPQKFCAGVLAILVLLPLALPGQARAQQGDPAQAAAGNPVGVAAQTGAAYAGRAIEGNSRSSRHFEVWMRLHNDATQTVAFAAGPAYRLGDTVRIDDRVIVRNP